MSQEHAAIERIFLGSARVSRAGFGVAAKRPFLRTRFELLHSTRKVRDREDAIANTRDACATPESKNALCFNSALCVKTEPMKAAQTRRPWYRPSLTMQIMIGLIVGGVIGWLRPDWGNAVYFLRDIFINLIKSIIAPLVFSTIVVGIAGGGALKKVGRMGAKALIYFEIVTTAALFIGLAIVNLTRPGIGVVLATNNTDIIKTIGQTPPKTLIETLPHAFPASV